MERQGNEGENGSKKADTDKKVFKLIKLNVSWSKIESHLIIMFCININIRTRRFLRDL